MDSNTRHALERGAEAAFNRAFRNAARFELLIQALNDYGTQYRAQGLDIPLIVADRDWFHLSTQDETLTLEEMVKKFMAALITARQKAGDDET